MRLVAAVMAALAAWCCCAGRPAARPVETGLFSVTGVDVDVTDKDASTARTRAIIEAQVKAFYVLAERLGSDGRGQSASRPESPRDRPHAALAEHRGGTVRARALYRQAHRPLPAEQDPRRCSAATASTSSRTRRRRSSSCRCGRPRRARSSGRTISGARPGSISRPSRRWCRSSCPWAISRTPAPSRRRRRSTGIRSSSNPCTIRYEAKAILVAIAEPDPAGRHPRRHAGRIRPWARSLSTRPIPPRTARSKHPRRLPPSASTP